MTFCSSHVSGGAVVSAAFADGLLAVPVCELHQVQHPDRHADLDVALPDGAAEAMDAVAGRTSGNIRLGLSAALAFPVARVAVIPANVHGVPLALSIPAVCVGRGDMEPRRRLVRDLEFQPAPALCPLEPEFRDSHQLARCGVA